MIGVCHKWNNTNGIRCCVAMKNIALLLSLVSVCSAQPYKPAEPNLKASQWFQDSKFGLFIHWGVYSVLGDGEWIMETRPINRADYAKLPGFFNPVKFEPAAWVAL